jgi:hypothetical protein
MEIRWDVTAPGRFDSEPLVLPARYSFPQGAFYRLKLSNIPGRPGVELYPTIEVAPYVPRTEAFLAHSAIPVQFTEEDFDQVLSGNFVTKVIYLPNPEHQELALAGVETLVSTRLEPGTDPIIEATRRGAILAVIRLGNKDLQASGGSPGAAGEGITPTGYLSPAPYPQGAGGSMGYIAGVTGPQYGMPMSGTPIGLPGPPHVPLGIPAGLQRHSIVNHTHVDLPEPTHCVRIDVKEKPGYYYPPQPNHVCITERAVGGRVQPPCAGGHGVCADGQCPVAEGEQAAPADPAGKPCVSGSAAQ